MHIDIDWNDFLNSTESILKHFFSEKEAKGLFNGKIVTTGFDDGNLVRIE